MQLLAEKLLQDANTPYKPKCAPEISDRIMAASQKVSAFSTVKHITSETAIQSIFNDALYGRRTLIDFYLGFDPASLHSCDILNGDANVVCLGPQDIDPKAMGGIVIEFDLTKLIQNKPAAFYKQRDFEYKLDKIREVHLGSETILFDHSGSVRCAQPTSTYLKIVDRWGYLKQIAESPKSSFISYNLEQIHEVLTLNFFRFMDNMMDVTGKIDKVYIDNFYMKVNQLNDEELLVFLTELERNMTDTAEFNFYGAHQIDFSTIININARYKGYTLNLPKFIDDLKQGNINELRQARIKIPELFQSYRFLDYLLLKVKHLDARYYLDDLRKQCQTPNWVQHIPLLIPEEFELSWEISSEIDEHSTGHDHLVQEDVFSKEAFQAHLKQFNNLILVLYNFYLYCGDSNDITVIAYQTFAHGLNENFTTIGKAFFTDVHKKDKRALMESFEKFKSDCERLSQEAEETFKHNTGLWSYVKPILTGFVGVVIAIAATILTLGIATYHVAKNERLRTKYIDTFFKSESGSIDAKNKWAQYAVKQKLFGDETLMNNGLVNEIEKTISTKSFI